MRPREYSLTGKLRPLARCAFVRFEAPELGVVVARCLRCRAFERIDTDRGSAELAMGAFQNWHAAQCRARNLRVPAKSA